MFTIAYVRTLIDYTEWATMRLLAAADGLAEEELAAEPVAHHGSLHATLVHTLGAERLWRERIMGGPVSPYLTPAEVPTLAALRTAWAAEYAAWREQLAPLDDNDLLRRVDYRALDGTPFTQPLWALLSHVANHGTQHRSEVAAMLTILGRSPGNLDMIVFYREYGL